MVASRSDTLLDEHFVNCGSTAVQQEKAQRKVHIAAAVVPRLNRELTNNQSGVQILIVSLSDTLPGEHWRKCELHRPSGQAAIPAKRQPALTIFLKVPIAVLPVMESCCICSQPFGQRSARNGLSD